MTSRWADGKQTPPVMSCLPPRDRVNGPDWWCQMMRMMSLLPWKQLMLLPWRRHQKLRIPRLLQVGVTGLKELIPSISFHLIKLLSEHINILDSLVQNCSNSSALAMEFLQSFTKPSICWSYGDAHHEIYFSGVVLQSRSQPPCWLSLQTATQIPTLKITYPYVVKPNVPRLKVTVMMNDNTSASTAQCVTVGFLILNWWRYHSIV